MIGFFIYNPANDKVIQKTTLLSFLKRNYLGAGGRMSIAVLLQNNPHRQEKLFSALQETSPTRNWKIFSFKSKPEIRTTLLQLKKQGFERVLIGGGDGTLHCAVEEILKLDRENRIPLAVVPLGTANDFAQSTQDSESSLSSIIEKMAEAPIEKIDVGFVNRVPFLNVVTGGDMTKATTEAPHLAKSTMGKFAYYLKGLTQLTKLEAHRLHFQDSEWQLSCSCMGFAVANGGWVGGGFNVAPEAKIDDGCLDLLIVPEQDIVSLTKIAKELLKENPDLKNLNVIYKKVKRVLIESESEIQINADGEPIQDKRFDFRIKPRTLEMAIAKNDLINAVRS